MNEVTLAIGDSVVLRGCHFGAPGRIIRLERSKAVILWPDLDYIGRHRLESLVIASPAQSERKAQPPQHWQEKD